MTRDAAARAAALDPRRSFIVQAPAGSGKTELLSQRYLRLLASVDAPEQILAITFTRKAAAEMRSRILQALEAAAGPAPESTHKRSTWELARAVREADARHGWQLLNHPARLRIQTIDALNASLARRLPLLAGTGAAPEPTDDPAPLYERAGRRLIERLGEDEKLSAQLEVLIVHLGNRVDRLLLLLADLLAKRDQWLHPVMAARASDNLRPLLEQTLQRVVEGHLGLLSDALGSERCRELFELMQHAAGQLLQSPTLAAARRTMLEACMARSQPPAGDSDSLIVWRSIAGMLFKEKGELYEKVDKRHGFPTTHPQLKTRLIEMLRWLATHPQLCERLLDLRTLPDPAYSEEQWRTLEALLSLLPQAVAELHLAFQAEGQADYVEVALRALRALGTAEEPTDLALAFDYRLQHILVDEFQDTSYAQLDLLERLTGGWMPDDGRTLFCVGDPMQSIYRFRQAEVGLFIGMQERGFAGVHLEPLRLEANFRSTPEVVRWINDVFPAVLAPANDAEQGAVRYSPSTAALTIEGGGVRVHPDINGDADAEALRVLGIVRDSLQEDPGDRIAILVTARSHVEAIARQLASAGIEFRAVEIEQLRERPVVQDLMALTRALVHLADRTAWFATLRAPWCGMSLADMHALAQLREGTVLDAMTAALHIVHEDLFAPTALSPEGRQRLERVEKLLRAALDERGRWPLRIWVERTWNALGGPATLSRADDLDDAEAFFGRLDSIETAGDLEDIARLDDQLARLFASGQMHGEPQVEIMTVHAAKGLEFETVILPGLQRRMRAEDRELLRWTRIAGIDNGMVLAPIKAEGSEGDSIYRWIELLERQRILRERARLLYVAATRAKRHLHLLGSVAATTREGETSLRAPTRGSMLHMLWHAVERDFDSATEHAVAAASRSEAPVQRLRRLPVDWRAPQLAEVSATVLPRVVELEEEPIFDWVSQTSRHVGTLVHRELERLCGATPHVNLSGERARLRAELAELGVPADRTEAACDRVVEALRRMLEDERGRWLLGLSNQISDAESEVALSGVVGGQIVEGVIDRTFVDEHGTRWIVDFKTSTHDGGGLDAFLDEETTRYRPQLARYASVMQLFRPGQTVRAALYFPLLRQWREVDLN
jgi:ATP-dependent exoDNAse (exonuclease V) beta subunit